MVRGPSVSQSTFTVSLNGTAVDHEEVKRAVACVQDFVRNPLFTQRNIFSQAETNIMNTPVAAADSLLLNANFPLTESSWGGITPSTCQFEVLSRDTFAAEEDSWRYAGRLVWGRQCCIIGVRWSCTPHCYPLFWCCWSGRWPIYWRTPNNWSLLL